MTEFYGTTVADIFGTMPARFKPEEAKNENIVIGYEIKGEGKWKVTIKAGTIKVEATDGELTDCNTKIIADGPETFIGVTLQKIAPMDALSNGKLSVVGDPKSLMVILPKVFNQYTAPAKSKDVLAADIISTILDRFRPDKAEGVNMKIGYDLTGANGGKWTIVIKDKKCAVTEGDFPADLTVKMIMEASTYVGMMTGKIDGTTAFMSGQVKIDGDMGVAGATAKFFDKYVDPNAVKTEELLSLKIINSMDQRFSTGPVMGKWFAGLKEKKFYANKCPVCGRTQVPPCEVCAVCRVRVDEFVEVGPNGTVENHDIVHFASPDPLTGVVRETPYAAIYFHLDHSTKDDIFSHELKREDIPKLRVGSRVRPVWAPKTTGSFRDILYFEIID